MQTFWEFFSLNDFNDSHESDLPYYLVTLLTLRRALKVLQLKVVATI